MPVSGAAALFRTLGSTLTLRLRGRVIESGTGPDDSLAAQFARPDSSETSKIQIEV